MARKNHGKGLYIAFEGLPGSGKTTQRKMLVDKLKLLHPDREVIGTREPGGCDISEAIRELAQGSKFADGMEPICEQYLLAAARAQSLRQVVKPILDRGGIVVSDYSFFTSVAFQGFGRKLTPKVVFDINRMATNKLWPDKVIVINTPIRLALGRTTDKEGDRFENLETDFYRRVKQGYRYLAKKYPSRVKIVNGVGDLDVVFKRVCDTLGLK